MASFTATVQIGSKTLRLEDLPNPALATSLRQAAQQVANRVAAVSCPRHAKAPTNIRIHFSPQGEIELAYESCCEQLGKAVNKNVR